MLHKNAGVRRCTQVCTCVCCAVTGTSGSALMYFRVNESPTMGRCSLTEDDSRAVAIEMRSQLRVFCTDWVDVVRDGEQ